PAAVAGFASVAAKPTAITPASIIARVATVTAEDIAQGAALRAQLPPRIQQATTMPTMVVPLLLGMLIDSDPALRAKQLQIVRTRLGNDAGTATELALGAGAEVPDALR